MGFICDRTGTWVTKGSNGPVTPRDKDISCGPIWPQFFLSQFWVAEEEEKISSSGLSTNKASGAQAIY